MVQQDPTDSRWVIHTGQGDIYFRDVKMMNSILNGSFVLLA